MLKLEGEQQLSVGWESSPKYVRGLLGAFGLLRFVQPIIAELNFRGRSYYCPPLCSKT